MIPAQESGRVGGHSRRRRTRLAIAASVPLVLVIGGVVVAALNTSVDRSSPPELLYPNPGGGWGEVAMPNIPQGGLQSYTGAMTICISKPGSVTINSVEGYGGNGGVTVTRVATRPVQRGTRGDAQGPLESLGFDTEPPIKVTTPCTDDEQLLNERPEQYLTDIGVEYKRISKGTGSVDGLTLTWTAGDSKRRELQLRFGMTLCAPGDRITPKCR